MNFVKFFQRRLYTFLNTCWGFTFFLLLIFLLSAYVIHFATDSSYKLRGGAETFPSYNNYADNIVGKNLEQYVAYGPIDVVYTWVNGSDPIWLKKKAIWSKKTSEDFTINHSLSVNETNSFNTTSFNSTDHNSSNNTNSIPSTSAPESGGEDDTMSSNRYRDSDELRYSIRSLIKNAPWIRHIYLVTDNQIPHWLNIENPKITLVSHEDIFRNKSHLPVFSSPAIEANLHNIPGLSRKFIYFNDDVFLGSPVTPDDFVSLSGTQKFYLAWEVPKCAPGCSDSWIGDGYCDRACNVSSCNFDFPDCINGSNVRNTANGADSNIAKAHCSKGCPDSWLADKVCDHRCNNEACGYDLGDCGIDMVTNHFPFVYLNHENTNYLHNQNNYYYSSSMFDAGNDPEEPFNPFPNDTSTSSPSTNDTTTNNTTTTISTRSVSTENHLETIQHRSNYLVDFVGDSEEYGELVVPYKTPMVYFNLSYIPCKLSSNTTCQVSNITGFQYSSAEHDDYQGSLVQHAVLIQKHHLLAVLLYHGQEGSPPPPSFFPYSIYLTVYGKYQDVDEFSSFRFRLMITDEKKLKSVEEYIPSSMGLIDYNYVGMTHLPIHRTTESLSVLKIPYQHKQEEGLVLQIEQDPSLLFKKSSVDPLSMVCQTIITLKNGQQLTSRQPATSHLLGLNSFSLGHGAFGPLRSYQDLSLTSSIIMSYQEYLSSDMIETLLSHDPHLLKQLKIKRKTLSQQQGYFLSIPFPVSAGWNKISRDWIHFQLNFYENESIALLNMNSQAMMIVSGVATWGTNETIVTNNTSDSLVLPPPSHIQPFEPISSTTTTNMTESIELPHNVSETLFEDDDANITSTQQRRRLTRGSPTSTSSSNIWSITSFISTSLRQFAYYLNPHLRPSKTTKNLLKPRRRLDTYASSLIHTNRLYNKAFGIETRKVPAHVPHMLDRVYLDEVQARWAEEWNQTSSHRFRSNDDIQYAYAYYYYVMNRHKVEGTKDLKVYLKETVDTDQDRYINPNEMYTLMTMMYKDTLITDDKREHLLSCISNSTTTFQKQQTIQQIHTSTSLGTIKKSIDFYPNPTIEELLACEEIRKALEEKVDWNIRQPMSQTFSDREYVAFEMIGDNVSDTLSQLNSIRQRQSKFICINDNMKHPSKELLTVLYDFYQSFYPFPSPFELPPGQTNGYLYIDEYRQWKTQQEEDKKQYYVKNIWISICNNIQQQYLFVVKEIKVALGQYLLQLSDQLINDSSSTTSSLHTIESSIHSDIRRNPLQSHHHKIQNQQHQESHQQQVLTSMLHLVLIVSVIGMFLFIILRFSMRSSSTSTSSRSSHNPNKQSSSEDWIDAEHGQTTQQPPIKPRNKPQQPPSLPQYDITTPLSAEVIETKQINKSINASDILRDDYSTLLKLSSEIEDDNSNQYNDYLDVLYKKTDYFMNVDDDLHEEHED